MNKIPTILYVYGEGVHPRYEQRHKLLPSLKYNSKRKAWQLTYRNSAGETAEDYVDGDRHDLQKASVVGQHRFKELTGVDVDKVQTLLQR